MSEMSEARCKHETLSFGSGGYYVFCDSCPRRWVAIDPRLTSDTGLDHSAGGDGLNGGDKRCAIVAEVEKMRTALARAKFAMEMNNWNWKSEASDDMKRDAYKAVRDALNAKGDAT